MYAVPPAPVVDSATVPPPVRGTLPEIIRAAVVVAALIAICPALEILPVTVSVVLLLMVSLSPLSIYRLPTVTVSSRVTKDVPGVPSAIQTFAPLAGTAPPTHIAALLQLPEPPIQLVVIPEHAVVPVSKNAALTDVSAVIVIVHVGVEPEHAPLH